MRYSDIVPIMSAINTIINPFTVNWQFDTNVSLHAEPSCHLTPLYRPLNVRFIGVFGLELWRSNFTLLSLQMYIKEDIFSHSHLLIYIYIYIYIRQLMIISSHLLATLHKISPARNLIIEINRRWIQVPIAEIIAKKKIKISNVSILKEPI